MSEERREFLNRRVLTGICGYPEAAWIVRIPIDGLGYLEREGHLKALANPPPGAQRYFLISYLLQVAQDEKWCAKAVKLLRDRNRRLNDAKREAKANKSHTNRSRQPLPNRN